MRKRLIAVTAAALLATACGSPAAAEPAQPATPPTVAARTDLVIYPDRYSTGEGGTAFYEVHVRLSDGRTVTCVVTSGDALSCDWAAK